jgi:hypothetical protein
MSGGKRDGAEVGKDPDERFALAVERRYEAWEVSDLDVRIAGTLNVDGCAIGLVDLDSVRTRPRGVKNWGLGSGIACHRVMGGTPGRDPESSAMTSPARSIELGSHVEIGWYHVPGGPS